MALSTFSDLKASVADWLARSDLTAQIPDFIRLAEVRINGNLRIQPMIARSSVPTVISQGYVDFPSGLLEVMRIKISGDPNKSLSYVTPEQLDAMVAGSTVSEPDVYTLIGSKIYLGPTPDAVYTLLIDNYQAFAALSDGAPTNWLITNTPDLYLYATLLEAYSFIRDDREAAKYGQLVDAAINRVVMEDERKKYSGSVLTVRPEVAMP